MLLCASHNDIKLPKDYQKDLLNIRTIKEYKNPINLEELAKLDNSKALGTRLDAITKIINSEKLSENFYNYIPGFEFMEYLDSALYLEYLKKEWDNIRLTKRIDDVYVFLKLYRALSLEKEEVNPYDIEQKIKNDYIESKTGVIHHGMNNITNFINRNNAICYEDSNIVCCHNIENVFNLDDYIVVNARPDFISENCIWELKTSKTKYSWAWVRQLIIYYILVQICPYQKNKINHIGIYNSVYDIEYLFNISDLKKHILFISKELGIELES